MKPADTTLQRDDLDFPLQAGLNPADVITKIRQKARVHDARRRRKRSLTCGAAVLVLGLFTAFWAVPTYRDTSTVATPVASRQTFDLQDGSRAELNAQTSFKTDFRYGRRHVTLSSGEAFFSVAKDPAHPFLVETPTGTVRVTGTKFNVRIDPAGQAEVTLFEGSIQMEQGTASPIRLAPAEQFSPAGVRALTTADLDRVTAWRDGRFILDGLSLGEAIARLSAYHGKSITVAPDAAPLQADGTVSLDNLGGALDALQVLLPINVFPTSDGAYRIVRR